MKFLCSRKMGGRDLSALFFITVLNSVDCRPMVNTFTQHSFLIIFASAFFATGGGVCVCDLLIAYN